MKTEVERLKLEINCVRDHPYIKPLNCCYHGDVLELKALRQEHRGILNGLKKLKKKAVCISSIAFHICEKHPEDCEYVISIEDINSITGTKGG